MHVRGQRHTKQTSTGRNEGDSLELLSLSLVLDVRHSVEHRGAGYTASWAGRGTATLTALSIKAANKRAITCSTV